jgi:hypothetical protein
VGERAHPELDGVEGDALVHAWNIAEKSMSAGSSRGVKP